MKHLKLTIRFVIAKNKTRVDGKAPLFCRLTFNNKRKQFAVGLFVKTKLWDSKKQIVKPSEKESIYLNSQISLIKQNINQSFLLLQVKGNSFSVEDVFLQYKGENITKEKSLIEVFNIHNENMSKLVGKEYTKTTYYKFREAKNHIKNFLQYKYNRKDILLSKIKLKFLEDFDFYLKSELEQKQITINKSIQRVRKIIKLALAEGYLEKDPFIMYKPKKYKVEVVYLNSKELKCLEDYEFSNNDRLQRVADCFVFCCYTGLAYAEMSALEEEHIINGFDGNKWIRMYRKKTGSVVNVPLLPQALKILEKYHQEENLLPIISNQKFNSYLKEIGVICGIKKKLTHHIARKTFATTVLLYNSVPMEVVSNLLGHSKMQITQRHYGKVVQEKVSEEINKLRNKFKN